MWPPFKRLQAELSQIQPKKKILIDKIPFPFLSFLEKPIISITGMLF